MPAGLQRGSVLVSREAQELMFPRERKHGEKSLAVGFMTGDVPRSLSGRILKWPTRADCKSAGLRLPWFESRSYHHSSPRPAQAKNASEARRRKASHTPAACLFRPHDEARSRRVE